MGHSTVEREGTVTYLHSRRITFPIQIYNFSASDANTLKLSEKSSQETNFHLKRLQGLESIFRYNSIRPYGHFVTEVSKG